MQPAHIALLAAILPAIALIYAYIVSSFYGYVPTCFPFLEGCTSISRAARSEVAIFLFRALVMPGALALILFWSAAYSWLRLLGDSQSYRPRIMFVLGSLGAVALILYVTFLGTQGEGYRLMRRFGIIFYFAFTGFAQFLLVSRMYSIDAGRLSRYTLRARRFALTCCMLLLLLALVSIGVSLAMEERFLAENVLEWNAALLMHLILFCMSWVWSRSGYTFVPTVSK